MYTPLSLTHSFLRAPLIIFSVTHSFSLTSLPLTNLQHSSNANPSTPSHHHHTHTHAHNVVPCEMGGVWGGAIGENPGWCAGQMREGKKEEKGGKKKGKLFTTTGVKRGWGRLKGRQDGVYTVLQVFGSKDLFQSVSQFLPLLCIYNVQIRS